MFKLFTSAALYVSLASAQMADENIKYRTKRFFRFAYMNHPHEDFRDYGGLDAYSISHDLLVVADGSGGHSTSHPDIDSDRQAYAKRLVGDLNVVFHEDYGQGMSSALKTALAGNPYHGSCSLLVAQFDEKRPDIVKTHLVGNSGYTILRPNANGKFELLFRSEEQYDKNSEPNYVLKEKEIPARSYEQFEGVDKEHRVQDKDVILAYTDGITDNLPIEEMIQCVNDQIQKQDSTEELEEVAYCVLSKAHEHSTDSEFESPYWKWKKNKDDAHKGGRLDDMSVVIGLVETHHSDQDIQQGIMTNAILGRAQHAHRWNTPGTEKSTHVHEEL